MTGFLQGGEIFILLLFLIVVAAVIGGIWLLIRSAVRSGNKSRP
jgi:hypothetical protein